MRKKNPQKVIDKASNRRNCIMTDLGLFPNEPYNVSEQIK